MPPRPWSRACSCALAGRPHQRPSGFALARVLPVSFSRAALWRSSFGGGAPSAGRPLGVVLWGSPPAGRPLLPNLRFGHQRPAFCGALSVSRVGVLQRRRPSDAGKAGSATPHGEAGVLRELRSSEASGEYPGLPGLFQCPQVRPAEKSASRGHIAEQKRRKSRFSSISAGRSMHCVSPCKATAAL